MALDDTPISCGIRTFSDLNSDPKENVLEILDEAYSLDGGICFSQIIFSDHIRYFGEKTKIKVQRGANLAAYIKTHKLGVITASPTVINRNTGNTIKTWIWTITNVSKVEKAVGWKPEKNDDDRWFY